MEIELLFTLESPTWSFGVRVAAVGLAIQLGVHFRFGVVTVVMVVRGRCKRTGHLSHHPKGTAAALSNTPSPSASYVVLSILDACRLPAASSS